MTKLCQEYGLSDNGLRKICKALSVPTPRAGHWAKLEAGKAAAATPLPVSASRTTYVVDSAYGRQQTPTLRDEFAIELKRKIALEKAEQEHAPQPGRIRWHNAMAPILALVRERRSYWKAQAREFKAIEARRKAGFPPEIGGYLWRSFLESGGLLFPKYRRFVLKVTENTCERSLAVLNAMCVLATRRGYEIDIRGKDCEALIIKHGDASVAIRILEKSVVSLRRDDSIFYKHRGGIKRESKPSGVLKMHVDGRYAAERIFEETADLPLEKQLSKILVYIHTLIARAQERSRAAVEAAVAREEVRRVREAEQALLDAERKRVAAEVAELRRIEQIELERERSLIDDAGRWRQADDLRQYIEAIERTAGESGGLVAAEAWLRWARTVLVRLDPIPQLLVKLQGSERDLGPKEPG
ncbi:hypothetical protein ACOTEK_24070 [Achromobacter xylosoxidans]